LLPDTATGRWLRDVVHEVEGAAAHAALFVAGCSRDDAAVLASEYDLDEASLVVVPNGVDTRAVPFVDGGRRAQSRRRWLDRFLADGDIRPAPRHVAVFFG